MGFRLPVWYLKISPQASQLSRWKKRNVMRTVEREVFSLGPQRRNFMDPQVTATKCKYDWRNSSNYIQKESICPIKNYFSFNPIGPGRFFDAYVPGGDVFSSPPQKWLSTPKKGHFSPWYTMRHNSSFILRYFANFGLKFDNFCTFYLRNYLK